MPATGETSQLNVRASVEGFWRGLLVSADFFSSLLMFAEIEFAVFYHIEV